MPQIMVAFALSYVSEILMLLHGDFGMSSDIVDSDQAVKRWSVKSFIASIFLKH